MIRKLRFEGSWYPSDKEELEKLIKVVPSDDNKDLFGVVPHAGLYYSSELIKLFFNNLNPNVNKILLITPSHYYALDNNVVGSGNIELFKTSIKDIEGFSVPSLLEPGYEQVTIAEHAVEMILPFIAQRDNIKLCCAHINRFNDVEIASDYAKKIINDIDDNTAVIASSDFTHYGNNFRYTPFGDKIDNQVLEKVTTYDRKIANGFISGDGKDTYIKAVMEDRATICGIAPMLVVSEIARLKNMSGRILGQSNSYEKSSFDNNFVSYLSLAWRK